MKKKQRSNYRKIYQQMIGPIPTDDEGNSYDIHHLDGNPQNNSRDNLIALSRQDHYDIHYLQGDWGACLAIKMRMKHTTDELRELSRLSNIRRVDNGTHHLLGGSQQRVVNKKRVDDGTHNWLGGDAARDAVAKQIAAGQNKLVGGDIQRKTNADRLENGTHHLVGPSHNITRIKNGNHPTQTHISCTCCRRVIRGVASFNQHYPACIRKDEMKFRPRQRKRSGTTQLKNGTSTTQRKVSCIKCHRQFSVITFTRHVKSPSGCFVDK